MAKIQITFALVTLLYLSEALPLGDSSESSSEASYTRSNGLGVHPLLTGTSESSSDTGATTEENSTGGALIEETYIEVLLPGSPQVNASALDALLQASSPNATKSKPSGPNQEPEEPSQAKTPSNIKPVLYAQQSRAVRDVLLNRTGTANNSAENQATNKSVPAVLIHVPLSPDASANISAQKDSGAQAENIEAGSAGPAVPSVQYKTRPARDISTENDCSSEEDSSAQVQESKVPSNLYPAGENDEHSSSSEDSSAEEPIKQVASSGESSQQQTSNSRYGRAIADETATETGSTETVVYITPEAKKLPVN